MKFGVSMASAWPFNELDTAVRLATAAEAAGFESLWTVEHVVWPENYESVYPYSRRGKMAGDPSVAIPDPLIWLSWVGAATSTIRLGTGVVILPLRNPLVLAKQLATLDAFSGGRLEVGIGVGWLEEEFDAIGVPFAGRGRRTDEYVAAMRTVWSDANATFAGEFVDFAGANVNPKPAQARVPITIGGHTEAAARRAGRIGDGFFPGTGSLEQLAGLFRIVRDTAERNGRDPAEIALTTWHPRGIFDDSEQRIDELDALGVERVVVPGFLLVRPDLDTAMAHMAQIIESYG